MRRVVLAEDDPKTRALMCIAISTMGCEVIDVGSGLELLETLAYAGPFDAIVTDLAMPHIDGVRVIAMVRNAGLRTPVLVVTALAPADIDHHTTRWLGDVTLLRKPFGLHALRGAVNEMFSLRAAG
jgi:two-component system OmpR family response regulator